MSSAILFVGNTFLPSNAHAQVDGSGWAILANDIAEWGATAAKWVNDALIPILRDQVVKRIIDDMTDDLVNAIATGETPLFVEDWQGFLGKSADIAFDELNTYLSDETGIDLCSPIRPQLQVYLSFLGNKNRLGVPVRCSISDFQRNVQYSYKYLIERNGWISFRQMYNDPANNFFGATLLIDDAFTRNTANRAQARQSEAIASQGFLSQRVCDESYVNPETGEEMCLKERIVTPGDVAASAATKATLKDFPYIENVQSVISAVVNKIIASVFSPSPGGGLAAAGSGSSISFNTGDRDDQRDRLEEIVDKWGAITIYFQELRDRGAAALFTSKYVSGYPLGDQYWFKFPRNVIGEYPVPGSDITRDQEEDLYEACALGAQATSSTDSVSIVDLARCVCLADDQNKNREVVPVTGEQFGWLAYANEYGTRSHVRLGISDFSGVDYIKDYFREIYEGVYEGIPIAEEALVRVQGILEAYDRGEFDDEPSPTGNTEQKRVLDGDAIETEDKGIDFLKILRDEVAALSDFASKYRYANEVTIPYAGGGPGSHGGTVQKKTIYAAESILRSLVFPDTGTPIPNQPDDNFYYCEFRT